LLKYSPETKVSVLRSKRSDPCQPERSMLLKSTIGSIQVLL